MDDVEEEGLKEESGGAPLIPPRKANFLLGLSLERKPTWVTASPLILSY